MRVPSSKDDEEAASRALEEPLLLPSSNTTANDDDDQVELVNKNTIHAPEKTTAAAAEENAFDALLRIEEKAATAAATTTEASNSSTSIAVVVSTPSRDEFLTTTPERTTTTTTSTVVSSPEQQQQLIHRHATSLAWAPTTSWLAFFIIPVAILATHALFAYGQTANMWRLTAQWQATVSYEVHSKEAQLAFHAIQLPLQDTFEWPFHEKDLRHYTYAHAIHDLWRAKGMPGLFLPRLAAVGLILFSGLWPHLKLAMLFLTWWLARHPVRRRRVLDSLSVLGKWSLVDVVVVCVLIGVVNLEWDFTAEAVHQGVVENWSVLVALLRMQYGATDLCGMALHYDCHHPSKLAHKIKCQGCISTINSVYEHPESAKMIVTGITTTGGGHAQMSVAGLSGIYSFCGAVILSILLSIIVDWYDHRSRVALEEERELLSVSTNEEQTLHVAAPEVSGTLAVVADDDGPSSLLNTSAASSSEDEFQQLLQAENGTGRGRRRNESRSQVDRDFDRQILIESQQCGNKFFQGATFVTMVSCVVATLCVTIERRVKGALPSLVHNILGVVWSKHYSFWGLAWTTGYAGGWDWMLMGTFAWFTIVGPIMRAILCFQASRVNETPHMTPAVAAAVQRRKRNLSLAIDFVGSFCAWEVYTVALVMVGLLLPGITGTIINDKRCGELGQDTDICLEVEYSLKGTFALVVVSGFMLLGVSQRIRNYKPPY